MISQLSNNYIMIYYFKNTKSINFTFVTHELLFKTSGYLGIKITRLIIDELDLRIEISTIYIK